MQTGRQLAREETQAHCTLLHSADVLSRAQSAVLRFEPLQATLVRHRYTKRRQHSYQQICRANSTRAHTQLLSFHNLHAAGAQLFQARGNAT